MVGHPPRRRGARLLQRALPRGRGSLAGRKTAGERKSLDMFDLEGLEGLDEEEMRLDVHWPIDSTR